MRDLWPTPSTVLLLRAALLDGAAARAAWAAWLAGGPPPDAEMLEGGDRRLLPLLVANLGADHPVLARGLVIAERARERNRALVAAAAEAMRALAGAGIETLALKGLALLLEHYGDLGLRPMQDIDLMVRPRDRERALAILRARGFSHAPIVAGLEPFLCAFDLVRDGIKLDVHQYLIEHGSSPDTERGLWERSHALDLGGASCRAPSPTDLLLHVCVASLKPSRHRNSRWVVDAARLLARGVDWPLLLVEARRRGMVLALRECLRFLDEVLPGRVPAPVLAEMAAYPVDAAERRTVRVLARHPATLPELASEYWVRYRFGARASGRRPSAAGFLRFGGLLMAQRWNLLSPWSVPWAAGRRLARRWS